MCTRGTESVKVVPESVLSNRRKSPKYALDRGGFSPGEVFAGVVISVHRIYVVKNLFDYIFCRFGLGRVAQKSGMSSGYLLVFFVLCTFERGKVAVCDLH